MVAHPDFLYDPLVDIIEADEEIDFCEPSDEKWDFAETLLSVLEKNIKEIPDEIFQKNGFQRKDILFFCHYGRWRLHGRNAGSIRKNVQYPGNPGSIWNQKAIELSMGQTVIRFW